MEYATQIARALAAPGAPRPRRSLVFVAFPGEEKGMLGSAAGAAHPGRTVVAMLNLDMIGRLRGGALEVGGVTTSPAWPAIVDAANQQWVDAVWQFLLNKPFGSEDEYTNSVTLLNLMVMSGNWWAP